VVGSVTSLRESARAHLDKWYFAVCWMAGGAVIWAVDWLDGSKWIAVGVCLAIMTLYLIGTMAVAGLKLRADQAADNLYYLGLLFTLTSLGVALFRFVSSEEATVTILRNFGIAIFTTIFGVGMRVFVGQFREDPEDLEAEAKEALAQTVHRMRSELDLSVAELRSFADGMKQVVGDFTEKANRSTAQALERAVGQFEKSAISVGERFETTAETFGARVQSFDGSLEKVVVALEALMTRIGAVRADADIVEQSMRPAIAALERSIESFGEAVTNQQGKLVEAGAAAEHLSASINYVAQAAEKAADASKQLDSVVGSLGRASDILANLDQSATSAAASTGAFAERLAAIASRAEDNNRETIVALQQVADATAARATEESRARLDEVRAAADSVAEALQRLNAEFVGSGETVQKVRRELTELAGWIIERLERA